MSDTDIRISRWEILRRIKSFSSFHKRYLSRHIQDFGAEIGARSMVFDIGSGSVPYKRFFDAKNYFAIDIAFSPEVDLVADLCNLPLRSNATEVVVCTEVIEHVENVGGALDEIHRVLKRGGYLTLTVPFLIGEHDTVDYHRFTEAMLRTLLVQRGFTDPHIARRGGILAVLSSLLLQAPLQILGLYEENHRSRWRYLLVSLLYVILLPLAWAIVVFDGLDREKRFTLGFDCICRKVD